jgi:hypothetical protein
MKKMSGKRCPLTLSFVLFGLSLSGCNRYAELTGCVVDNGKPVLAERNSPDPPMVFLICRDSDNQRSIGCALTPETGRFVAYAPDGSKNIPPGKYKVGFTYGTGAPKTGTDFYPDEATLELDLEAGQRLDVTIDAAARSISR